MLRHLAALGLTVLLFWPGNCGAQTAEAVRVGDRWSYDVMDGATGDLKYSTTIVVVEFNDKEITTRLSVAGRPRQQTVVHDRNWGVLDNGEWQFRPSGFGIKIPLHVGKEWRSDVDAKHLHSGAVVRASTLARVLGQEQITTLAGTFDTYRVEAKERQIDSRDQTRATTVTHGVWYAPAVNRWVKRTFETRSEGRVRESYVEELTEYSRKP